MHSKATQQTERQNVLFISFVQHIALRMKVLIWLFGFLCLTMAKPPTLEQVRNAIAAVRQTSTRKREVPMTKNRGIKNTAAECPMTMHHGYRKSNKIEGDTIANDLLRVARDLMDAGFTKDELRSAHVVNEFRREAGSSCHEDTIECDVNAKYRTFDGKCNNLLKPFRGSAGVPQRRLLPPVYDDGLSSPRTQSVISGEFLPNTRLVSNKIHRDKRRPRRRRLRGRRSNKMNMHVFQMGQFLDHDMVATPVQSEVEDCCVNEADVDNCMPIRINWDNDPNKNFQKGYCMNFQRSAPKFCPTVDDTYSREQINGITSFVDGSNVYASSAEDNAALRNGAFMATQVGNRLPYEPNNEGCTPDVEKGMHCSSAGDHRANENPSLIAYHTLWVREHNRIVKQLEGAYTDDEELFQEARRILIACMQKIVYNEFLPMFLSERTMEEFKLLSAANYTYDPYENPSIFNEFATAAFRFGHTLIPRRMNIFNQNYSRITGERTMFTYFDPTLTYFDGEVPGLDGLTIALGARAFESDRIIEKAARDFLFLDADKNSFDLAALNIQRGRDHGLDSYVNYRVDCGLDQTPIDRFEDLADHDPGIIKKLRKVYRDVGDIDLFSGGLSERPVDTGAVGPVFQCIMGRQFKSLKFGDRFWYQGEAAGFSTEQLDAIEQYTMTKVLCNNYEFRTVNYPNAFQYAWPEDLTNCDTIPNLNITSFLPSIAKKK